MSTLVLPRLPMIQPRRALAGGLIALILLGVLASCPDSSNTGGDGGGYRHTESSDEAQLRQHGTRRDLTAWEKSMRDQARRKEK